MKQLEKYWTRANGTKVLIADMAIPYIENCIKLIDRHLSNLPVIWDDDDDDNDPCFLERLNLCMKRQELVTELKNKRKKPTRLKLQELFRCNIAGVQYSDYQLAKLSIRPGARLQLWWERSNKEDSQAIRVELKGVKLGYIPATSYRNGVPYNTTHRTILHNLREKGTKIITTLVSYNPTNPTWNMFTIKCEAKLPVVEIEKEVEL